MEFWMNTFVNARFDKLDAYIFLKSSRPNPDYNNTSKVGTPFMGWIWTPYHTNISRHGFYLEAEQQILRKYVR